VTRPVPVTGIRVAHPDESELLARLLASAFLHGDLAPWLIPEVNIRARAYPTYFAMFIEHALVHGIVHVDDELRAVALWHPHGDTDPRGIDDYDHRLAVTVGRSRDRFRALDAAMHDHHPTERHHYLAFLAVHPDHQGNGLGGALLKHHHDFLDADGTPAYLEATGPRNEALYARCGYKARKPYAAAPGGPLLYPMWRIPVLSDSIPAKR
jgi:GNAT superfamily N-acetyltransferase